MADFVESLVHTFKDNWILGLGVNAILCLFLGALTIGFGMVIKIAMEHTSYLIVIGFFIVAFGILGTLFSGFVIKEGEHKFVSLLKIIIFFLIGGFIGYSIGYIFVSLPDGALIPSILWFAFFEWIVVSGYVYWESGVNTYERR